MLSTTDVTKLGTIRNKDCVRGLFRLGGGRRANLSQCSGRSTKHVKAVSILLEKVPVEFKIDTGADVTVVPEHAFT